MSTPTLSPLPLCLNDGASRALLEHDATNLRAAFEQDRHMPTTFRTYLPEIVGYVPEDERDYFSGPATIDTDSYGPAPLERWPSGLSGMAQVILEDLERIGYSPEGFDEAIFEMAKRPRFETIHIDRMFSARQAKDVLYLTSDQYGTVFHEVIGTVFRGFGLELSNDFTETKRAVAPDFAIVRMTNATAHSSNPDNSKVFTKSLSRVGFNTSP